MTGWAKNSHDLIGWTNTSIELTGWTENLRDMIAWTENPNDLIGYPKHLRDLIGWTENLNDLSGTENSKIWLVNLKSWIVRLVELKILINWLVQCP